MPNKKQKSLAFLSTTTIRKTVPNLADISCVGVFAAEQPYRCIYWFFSSQIRFGWFNFRIFDAHLMCSAKLQHTLISLLFVLYVKKVYVVFANRCYICLLWNASITSEMGNGKEIGGQEKSTLSDNMFIEWFSANISRLRLWWIAVGSL